MNESEKRAAIDQAIPKLGTYVQRLAARWPEKPELLILYALRLVDYAELAIGHGARLESRHLG